MPASYPDISLAELIAGVCRKIGKLKGCDVMVCSLYCCVVWPQLRSGAYPACVLQKKISKTLAIADFE